MIRIFLTLSLFFALHEEARCQTDGRWVRIGQAVQEGASYVILLDTTTLERPAPGLAKGWIRSLWSVPQNESSDSRYSYDEGLTLVEADCKSRRIRASGMMMKRQGQVVLSDLFDNPGDWMASPPGTAAETILQGLCRFTS